MKSTHPTSNSTRNKNTSNLKKSKRSTSKTTNSTSFSTKTPTNPEKIGYRHIFLNDPPQNTSNNTSNQAFFIPMDRSNVGKPNRVSNRKGKSNKKEKEKEKDKHTEKDDDEETDQNNNNLRTVPVKQTLNNFRRKIATNPEFAKNYPPLTHSQIDYEPLASKIKYLAYLEKLTYNFECDHDESRKAKKNKNRNSGANLSNEALNIDQSQSNAATCNEERSNLADEIGGLRLDGSI